MGYRTFLECFHDCCVEASTRLAFEHSQSDPEAIRAGEESSAFYQALLKHLGDDASLLLDYEVASGGCSAINSELVYRQGFQDCISLLRWMGAL